MREAMLIIHFIGLGMGLGTSIGFIFLGKAAAKLEKEDAQKFILTSFSLSRMGQIGLTLLVITGMYLMTPFWSTLSERPLLMAKLGLVIILIALIVTISLAMKKAKKGNLLRQRNKIQTLGKIALLTVIVIISLAVITFH